MAQVVDGSPSSSWPSVWMLSGHVQLDALRVQRVVAPVGRRQADHERPQGETAEAALADPVLQLAQRVAALAAMSMPAKGTKRSGWRSASPATMLVRDERLAARWTHSSKPVMSDRPMPASSSTAITWSSIARTPRAMFPKASGVRLAA